MISGRGIAPTRCRAKTDGASATSTSPARVVTNWVSPGRCRGTKPKTRERLRSASGQKRLTMTEVSSIVEVVSKRVPWNKGKIVGAKPPLLISGTGWMPLTTDIAMLLRHVRFVPIVLQKSFCITDCKFSGPYVRRSNNHLRDYIILP
jgi:hypothetical protein